MKIKYILLSGFVVFIFSCMHQVKQEGITVSGQFLNATGKKITFSELLINNILPIDSMTLNEQGNFRFTRKTKDAGFYLVKSSSGENVVLLMEKEESAIVTADFKKAPFDYQISGSPGSFLLKKFYDQTYINLVKADSLTTILKNLTGTPKFHLQSLAFDSLFLGIMNDQKILEKDFLIKNDKSLASLIVLNYKFGMQPVISEEEDFDLYTKLDSSLIRIYPSNKHAQFLHQLVTEHIREQTVIKLRQKENQKK